MFADQQSWLALQYVETLQSSISAQGCPPSC